ncbi:ELWxxDGT repeat protein [Archangium sp.]|uniref:ELWxxDGT repeat protein n=1 Tax=Archangium sp. TaxID=1872627 RepID=UPI002D3F7434|nr:ELWxxDGT repeat protein [Archangium sp.]HYO55359.1 ELWxxDGT repeat protein [Archangium sp.]
MKRIRGALGCLTLALAAMGGCADSERQARQDVAAPARPGQQRSALTLGEPELVRDIRPPALPTASSPGSDPRNYLRVGSTLFFTASDPLHGRELWASDGTATGTRLVRDIFPGSGESRPEQFTELNGVLYFRASTGTGDPLWRSDGTPEGTRPILAGSRSLYVAELALAGGTLYLSANGGEGLELWKSDGTDAGTQLVKDIHPTGSSSPERLRVVNGTLYFLADDGVSGQELWTSDGTPEGTRLVKDLTPGPTGTGFAYYQPLGSAGGTLYFSANLGGSGQELWKSDGTSAGTQLVKDIWPGSESSSPEHLTEVEGTLYFAARSGGYWSELWKSDGTPEGTRRVVERYSVEEPTDVSELRDVGGVLHFKALGSGAGHQVWKSDGTSAGTVRITDIQTGSTYAVLGSLGVAGSHVYFFAANPYGEPGYALWRTTGTRAGTEKVRTFEPGVVELPTAFAANGNTLFFAAHGDGLGAEPWKTDGTSMGTVRIADVHGPGMGSQPQKLVALGETLLFSIPGEGGAELWKSSGTAPGTVRFRSGFPQLPQGQVSGGRAYFEMLTGGLSAELWASDGTEAGTRRLQSFTLQGGDRFPLLGQDVGGTFLFGIDTEELGLELWRSDGTEAGTRLVKDIWPGRVGSYVSEMVNWNGTLYFLAEDGVHGAELWKSDGTPEGTVLAKDILPGPDSSIPSLLEVVNGSLVFTARREPYGQPVLWRLDAAGDLHEVTAAGSGESIPSPGLLTAADGTLFFFTGFYSGQVPTLWKYDGTSTSATPVAVDRFRYTSAAMAAGKALYFQTHDPEHGSELWRSDGTSEGTRVVKDILPGPMNGLRELLLGLADRELMFFSATDGVHGLELWVSDGTETGTQRVKDLAPGPRTSNPRELVRIGDNIFFSADDGTHGTELWRLPLTPKPPDTTPPELTCPLAMTVEATSASGATVNYPDAVTTDDVTASPEVTYSQASGTVFPLEKTRVKVKVTAKDAAGNTASCGFDVTVRDTTAPVITCPADVTVESQEANGRTVDFTPATATDVVTTTPAVLHSREPGSDFPVGTTPVTAVAMDAASNEASCSFRITVKDAGKTAPKPPDSGLGCAATGGSPTGLWGALALLAWLALRSALPLPNGRQPCG